MGLKNYNEQKKIINGLDEDIKRLLNVADLAENEYETLSNTSDWLAGQEKYNILYALTEVAGEATNISNMIYAYQYNASNILEKLNLLENLDNVGKIISNVYNGNRYSSIKKNISLYKGDMVILKDGKNIQYTYHHINQWVESLEKTGKHISNTSTKLDKYIKNNSKSAHTLTGIRNRVEILKDSISLLAKTVSNIWDIYIKAERSIREVAKELSLSTGITVNTATHSSKNDPKELIPAIAISAAAAANGIMSGVSTETFVLKDTEFRNRFEKKKSSGAVQWTTFEPYKSVPEKLKHHMSGSLNQKSYNLVNKYKINIGCCATAYAIGLSVITGTSHNPESYASNGVCIYGSVPIKKIDVMDNSLIDSLDKGNPVMIHYNYYNTQNGRRSEHWVLAVGIDENANMSKLESKDIIVIDPASGEEKLLKDAWNYSYKTNEDRYNFAM